ncbi:hypothetical protein PSEUBRA_004293 [Kalmanozyma brasiliensis GHG001]|uniref:SET domain-containing protein n=1 Tax=Kalmanozyma brasiliensis (strain GHG001) TaxID=1365824 RepID=V5GKA2_KALBG|nr:uncharacterized protein PSEUBRA_004293 [Kalmanozyma brasiliensis GHG001]EST06397.1 hypothetical protein PSEUBRA_004293 [Kalmanozyma brasiliensis GHG001]
MDSQHPLLEWFSSVGIQLHPSLYLEQDPATGLSFYTSQPLPPDTTVIQVPSSLCITSSSAFERIQKLCEVCTDRTTDIDQSSLPAADWILLYLVLSRLAIDFPSSDEHAWLSSVFTHLPYVAHIPRVIETPLHFSPAELALLANTPLVGSTERRLRETIVDYTRTRTLLLGALHGSSHAFVTYLTAILTPIIDEQDDPLIAYTHLPGLELWRWAESAFTSRTFPPRLIDLPSEAPILIPGYDTFNHARAHPVTWSSANGNVCMTLNHPVPGGAQVFNNYGGKSNEEFLSSYGFTLPTISEDTLALKLAGEGKTHYWVVPAISSSHSDASGTGSSKTPSPCPTLMLELEQRVLQGEAPPTSAVEQLELYGEVLETLESLLLAKRKAFRASQKQIDSQSPALHTEQVTDSSYCRSTSNTIRPSVWTNIMQYRKGQLHLLNHAVDWTRTELERVADALDEH